MSSDLKNATLQLAILKANFVFLDFVDQFVLTPWEICPELRRDGEELDAYQRRIMLMISGNESFFGGIADHLPMHINPMFIYETQAADIPAEDVITLLRPTTQHNHPHNKLLLRMLPRLFHYNAVIEVPPPNNAKGPQTSYTVQEHERLLLIDLSRPYSELIAQFKQFINNARDYQLAARDLDRRVKAEWDAQSEEPYPYQFAKPWDIYTSRTRQATWDQLRVWEFRSKRMNFSDIATKMNKQVGWVSTSYYRIFAKTQGYPYSPEHIANTRRVRQVELEKTCSTCPTRLACSEPCPEILRYIDQDVRPSAREKLFSHVAADTIAKDMA